MIKNSLKIENFKLKIILVVLTNEPCQFVLVNCILFGSF